MIGVTALRNLIRYKIATYKLNTGARRGLTGVDRMTTFSATTHNIQSTTTVWYASHMVQSTPPLSHTPSGVRSNGAYQGYAIRRNMSVGEMLQIDQRIHESFQVPDIWQSH